VPLSTVNTPLPELEVVLFLRLLHSTLSKKWGKQIEKGTFEKIKSEVEI